MYDLKINNATLVNEGHQFNGAVLVKDKKIAQIIKGSTNQDAVKTIDASGLILIPGVIDDQVHFRQPGLTHKGNIWSESRAAAAGGVTSYMEMPNTNPQTIDQNALKEKFNIASKDSLVNYSFYIGATNDNLEELLKTDSKNVCGVKIFMGSSTGNMLVDNLESLQNIFSQVELPIAVHCEDENIIRANTEKYRNLLGDNIPFSYHPIIRNEESCYKSSCLAVELATKYGTRLHILHISTGKELGLFTAGGDLHKKKITSEVCVHHLWFNDSDYEKYGSKIKWNPAIKSKKDQEALFNGVLNDKIDVIATDHAPHTIEEKSKQYFGAPSGGPLVQHSLTAMLEFYKNGKISLEKVVHKMCHAPAEIFHISKRGYLREGYWADLVLVDLNTPWTVNKSNLLYRCGWSPFEDLQFHTKVHTTIVNGSVIFMEDKLIEGNSGLPLEFER
jgi:dihydroorotase